MLVTIPIGLWVFSLVGDLIRLATGEPMWSAIAFYTLLGGEVGAIVAAVPGLIDFKYVRERFGQRARRVVTLHMALNLAAVAMVGVNLWLRTSTDAAAWPVALSAITIAVLAVSGWLGGELVHVLGVSTPRPPEADSREVPARARSDLAAGPARRAR
jgi:uncharacterized membrane protein